MASPRKDSEQTSPSDDHLWVSREEFEALVERLDRLYKWAKNGQVW